ncbi:MAG: methyltransferase domain-containing protein [bacterium]|nr:methyltransferase domain-containing protein [bacterium]
MIRNEEERTSQFIDQRVCKLCDIHDFEDPEFGKLAVDIFGDPAISALHHRKLWEFTITVKALQRYGLWNRDSRGLSVAAGFERVLYYMTNFTGRIVATDIYGEGDFIDLEATGDFLINPEKYRPYEYERERLSALKMNALNLHFPKNLFDFAFCLSSIEHFGGVSNAAVAISEMGNVVRPGGLVIVTTDCSIDGSSSDQVFSPAEIKRLVKKSGLELVEDIDFYISPDSQGLLLDMLKDNLDSLPHINLKFMRSKFTSICLVFQKKGREDNIKRIDDQEFDRTISKLSSEQYPTKLPIWAYWGILKVNLFARYQRGLFRIMKLMGNT